MELLLEFFLGSEPVFNVGDTLTVVSFRIKKECCLVLFFGLMEFAFDLKGYRQVIVGSR